jgi:hypothetical protein
MKKQSGFGLLLMVGLIAVSGIMITTSTLFFANMAKQTQLRIDQTKAYYLAQAGVMRAAWDWYVFNTATEISRRWAPINTTVTGNNLFKVASDSAGALLHSNFAYYVFKKDATSGTGSGTITHVQNVGTQATYAAGTTTILTLAVGKSTTVGNLLIVYFTIDGIAGTVSCADTGNNVYTVAADAQFAVPGTGNVRTVILYAPVTTGLVAGNTITVTHPSRTAKAMSVHEFSGVASVETSAVATGTGTAASSGNATTTFANSLLIGALGVEGILGDTFTPGAGYSAGTRTATANATATNNVTIDPEWQIVSTTGTRVADGGVDDLTNRDWAAAQATFYGSAGWFTSGANRRLQQWQVRNINNGNSVTLDQVKISWSPAGAELLNDFFLNGVSKWPGGTFASGSTVNITDTVLGNGAFWGDTGTYIQWNGAVNGGGSVTVTCQFIYSGNTATSDAKSHEVVMWNGTQTGGGLPAQKTFTVTSTGQVNQNVGGYFKVMKTVKAAVSGTPGLAAMEIVDWDEGDKNIP